MASGIPIIAGKNSGATKEVIKNCGHLTDVRSSKSIVNSILKYNNKKIYNQKKILGLKRANKYFNLNIVTENYIKYLKHILNNSNKL